MLKRILTLLLCCAALFSFCGCTSILTGDFISVTDHVDTSSPDDTQEIPKAETYTQLYAAILDMVTAHVTSGHIRVYEYSGNIEMDVATACAQISENTPIGAFSVYHMRSSITKIVSFHEIEISITYKRSAAQTADIAEISNSIQLQALLNNALLNFTPYLVLKTNSITITPESVTATLEKLYYSDPERYLTLPSASITVYPPSEMDRILEINLNYPYESAQLSSMRYDLRNAIFNAVLTSHKDDPMRKAAQLCSYLGEHVQYDSVLSNSGQYNRQQLQFTAYGALVGQKAVGEGYAMAFKILCDRNDIECLVVTGRLNDKPHSWNILCFNGEYYHVDPAICSINGMESMFLKTDEDLLLNKYWWDTGNYPTCSGTLTYADLIMPPEDQPTPSEPPIASEPVPETEN